MNKSSLKTLLIREGFVPVGYGSNKRTNPFRTSYRYHGRLYRFSTIVYDHFKRVSLPRGYFKVDISVPVLEFDRWSNSLSYSIDGFTFLHDLLALNYQSELKLYLKICS
jgi:hypothetical protein